MGPDQTAPLGEVWLKLLAFATAIKFIWWHKSPRRLVILNMICILPLELLSLLKRGGDCKLPQIFAVISLGCA